jgi:hypothetical protein
VAIANAASQNVTDTFTLEAWVKRTNAGVYGAIIADGDTGAGNVSFDFRNDNTFDLDRSGVGPIAHSNATYTDTASYHHLVTTKSGSTRKLYYDGADVTSLDTDFTFSTNVGWKIGRSPDAIPMNGYIAEAAVYATALSAARVLAHYTRGASA